MSVSKRRAVAPEDIPDVVRRRAIAAVDARLVRAKERFSIAALGCLRGTIDDAAPLVRQALEEVERARALLAQAEADA